MGDCGTKEAPPAGATPPQAAPGVDSSVAAAVPAARGEGAPPPPSSSLPPPPPPAAYRVGHLVRRGDVLLLRRCSGGSRAFEVTEGVQKSRHTVVARSRAPAVVRYCVNDEGDGVLRGAAADGGAAAAASAWAAEVHFVTLADGRRVLDVVADGRRVFQLREDAGGLPVAVGYPEPFPEVCSSRAELPAPRRGVPHYCVDTRERAAGGARGGGGGGGTRTCAALERYKQGAYAVVSCGEAAFQGPEAQRVFSVRTQADKSVAVSAYGAVDAALVSAFVVGREWL